MLSRLLFVLFMIVPSRSVLGQQIETAVPMPTDWAAEFESSGDERLQIKETVSETKTSLAEVLSQARGVQLQDAGGQYQLISLRGSNTGHTAIYLDGVLLNDPSSSDQLADLNELSPFNVSETSIRYGPQSGHYGADGLAGVIDIKSRRPTINENRVFLKAGSFGKIQTGLVSNQVNTRGVTTLGLDFKNATGISTAAERLGNSEEDGYSAQTFFANHAGTSRQWKYNASLRLNQSKQDADQSGGVNADDPDFVINKDQWSGAVNAERPVTRNVFLISGVHLTQFRREYIDQVTGSVPEVREDRYTGDRQGALFGAQWRLQKALVYLGADAGWEHAEINHADVRRNSQGLFAEYTQKMAALRLELASRVDNPSDEKTQATSRVTPVLTVIPQLLDFKGTVSSGFRAPSLSQKFDPQFGNADLKSEVHRYRDANLILHLSPEAQFQVGSFRSDYENLIAWDFVNSRLNNISKAEIEGQEISLSGRGDLLSGQIQYTQFQKIKDVTSNRDLLRRPKEKWAAGFELAVSRDYSLSVDYSWYSRRTDIDTTTFNPIELKPYGLLNLGLKMMFEKNNYVLFELKNVMDEDYETAYGYGTEGFGAYLGAQFIL